MSVRASAKIKWEEWCKSRSDFTPIEEYQGANIPIDIKCTKCGIVSKRRPNDIKNGHGCKECKKNSMIGNTNWEFRNVNPKRFVDRNALINMLGKDYEICTEGTQFRSTEPIEIKHLSCGQISITRPFLIELGRRCQIGLCKNGTTHEDFLQKLSEQNPSIIPLEEYQGSSVKIKFQCLVCAQEWEAVPYSILAGHGCPQCWSERRFLSNEEFLKRVNDMEDGADYQFLSEYKSNQEKLPIRHLICEHSYEVSPWHFLHGRRCPRCATLATVSNKEKEVRTFVESLGLSPVYNDRTILQPMELDIYIPEKKLAIEFNGNYWHGENQKPNNYHYQKSLMCEQLGIRLIHIFEHEWDDARQRPILENIIKHAAGFTSQTIYARKCSIEVRESKTLVDFFQTNNIQGFRGGKFAICLVYQGEVVMSYVMGHCFFGKGKYEWEVIRGATKLGFTVIGGASKIMKYFITTYEPANCVYYIDYNYFNGNSLSSMPNMEYITTQVSFKNYWVKHWKTGERNIVKNREPLFHKEVQEAIKNGLGWRIYNAGTKTYVWTNPSLKK